MAEWTGARRTGYAPSDPQGRPEEKALSEEPLMPRAPGAVGSPQQPGQVPDRSSIPGHQSVTAPPPGAIVRPLTEYGTAQWIMGVYAAAPGEEMDPKRFEQAPVSYEEARKANPDLGTPLRPRPGYALDRGAPPAKALATAHDEAGIAAAADAQTGGAGAAQPDPAAVAAAREGKERLVGSTPGSTELPGERERRVGESTWAAGRPDPATLAEGGRSVSEQVAEDGVGRAGGAAPPGDAGPGRPR